MDDVLGSKKLCAGTGKLHSTTRRQTSQIFAKKSEELINSITTNAAKLGLKVNAKKTQRVCVSSSISNDISTFIRDSGTNNRVQSGTKMKILGFHFSDKPTVQEYVSVMEQKIKQRLWLLRNLRNAKATKKDLLDSYCCFLRPVLDYCSNVYHSMLNKQMTNRLEKLQISALRIIYGYEKSKE